MRWVFEWASVVVVLAVVTTVAIIDPHMSPAFFAKAVDLYALLLLALAVQQRYFAFTDPSQSPIALLVLFVYVLMGGGAALLAVGDSSVRAGFLCVPLTLGGLAGMLFALATSSFVQWTSNAQQRP